MSKIGKKIDIKSLGYSLGFMAVGVLLLYRDIAGNLVWKMGRFIFPKWLSYGIDIALLVAGVFLFIASLKKKKCNDCNEILELDEISFPLEAKDSVVEALNSLNFELLEKQPLINKGENCVELLFEYCDKCAKVAEYNIFSVQEWEREEIVPETEISGEAVLPIVNYVIKNSNR